MKSIHFLILMLLIIIAACKSTDSTENAAQKDSDDYTETHRPQFHFSPAEKWMNDPNGMVYYEGEYHLFYQYYPDDIVWGPMHWGHAVSTDLVGWEHLPIALYPDSLGYIFSGSAVVDYNNTSGFGEDGKPPLIAIYTYHLLEGERAGRNDYQYQAIAYSNDKGRTWRKYEGNPVVPNPGVKDFRDPKVIWDEESGQWVMVFAAYDHVKLYGSKDLKSWTYLSDFGREYGAHTGVWECPDFFPMTIEGTGEKRWVMLQSINPGHPSGGSGTQYFVGNFEGKNFTIDENFGKSLGNVAAIIPKGKVFADFEKSYGKWTAKGDAFGDAPAKGTLARQNTVTDFTGSRLVNTFQNGDGSTGTLTSAEFTIDRDFMNFQIGGGAEKGKTCMNLLAGNKTLRSATGDRSEKLVWRSWEVADLKGKTARLQIVDSSTGEWGHTLVDQIMFADKAVTPAYDKAVWLDYGRDNYAGVTWSDVPKSDGRRIFMGWMSNWAYAQKTPTEKWRSAMTLARNLRLVNTPNGLRILSEPVEEQQKIRGKKINLPKLGVNEGSAVMQLNSPLLEGILEVNVPKNTTFALVMSNSKGERMEVGFDAAKNEFFTDRTKSGKVDFDASFSSRSIAPREASGETVRFHVFFDVASVELFADGGATSMTDIFFPNEDYTTLTLESRGGKADIISGVFWELEGAW